MRMSVSNDKSKDQQHINDQAASNGKRPGGGHRHLSDPTGGSDSASSNNGGHHEPDLFSILSSMHLTNQINAAGGPSGSGGMPHPVLVASRKRKILDAGGAHGSSSSGGGSGKMNNGMRHPTHRRHSDDDDEAPLQTPQCSQSGYADEEDRHADAHESHAAAIAAAAAAHLKSKRGGFMSPEIHDIVDDNLAADFDGSLSGLGVDIHAASFSMSEALNALPNLSISSSQIFKQEVPSPTHHSHSVSKDYDALKNEPVSNISASSSKDKKNYGALDLSNDEAYLPETGENRHGDDSAPMTFTGSVSRESTPSLNFSQQFSKMKQQHHQDQKPQHSGSAVNLSASNPNLSNSGESVKSHKVILPLQAQQNSASGSSSYMNNMDNMKLEKRSYETIAIGDMEAAVAAAAAGSNGGSDFQYILAASTSIATKLNEPSITYLNQGQAYELRMKKLGDLSAYRKRLLKCVLRICFHERRLQYMEAEQIYEWSSKHPGERIIDVDLPLSYGVVEPIRDSKNINSLSFKWDPTRDTGIFIKVNCISTEFTPKKHGGEKGVPFRLQVETYDNDSRIHAAGCILQVFKLKGADRKHKQDRDKISKRPVSEQEKYSPSFECTVLADLPLEHIYVPASISRPGSPIVSADTPPMTMGTAGDGSNHNTPVGLSRVDSENNMVAQDPAVFTHLEGSYLDATNSVSQVTAWLMANRFSSYLSAFRNYNGRDMMRLVREEAIALCGPSDGIRLYNDLHMVPIPPRATFYVGAKDGDNDFSALYLVELTAAELLKKLGEAFGIDDNLFSRAFVIGPKGIFVRLTDSVVRLTKPESVFQFSLRSTSQHEATGGFDVVFEEVTTVQCVSNETMHQSPASCSN